MNFRLHKLILHNFKGIKDLTIEANGANLVISGDNGTGKTTVADAFFWLLFGKDSANRSNFEIKTIGMTGAEHFVEGVFTLDEQHITLKRVYYERWVKKTGSAERVFSGHKTDYYINDVPAKEKEYTDKIASIVNEETFKLLTNPMYFNEKLSWQKQRELLIEVCGDIETEDVISADARLKALEDKLSQHSIDDLRKILAAQMRKVNSDLEKIPVRIDEVIRNRPDISSINFDVVRAGIEKIRQDNEKLQEQISQLQASGSAAEMEVLLAKLRTELANVKRKMDDERYSRINAIREKLSKAKEAMRNQQSDIAYFMAKKMPLKDSLEKAQRELAEKGAEYKRLRTLQPPEIEISTVCPTCGQDLPFEKIEEARENHIKEFNRKRSESLMRVEAEGKELSAKVKSIKEEIQELDSNIDKLKAGLPALQEQIQALENELIDTEVPPADELNNNPLTKEYQALLQQINDLQAEITIAKATPEAEIKKLRELISTNIKSMEVMQSSLAKEQQVKDADRRIQELKEEERKLAQTYADLEKQMFLTDEFIRTKVKLLDEKINNRFVSVKFKLFHQLVNGSLEETCQALINTNGMWVPYSDANNAGKINAGIQLINVLSDHYGFTGPIIVDNAEAVNSLHPTYSQVIKLVVTTEPTLTINKEE